MAAAALDYITLTCVLLDPCKVRMNYSEMPHKNTCTLYISRVYDTLQSVKLVNGLNDLINLLHKITSS